MKKKIFFAMILAMALVLNITPVLSADYDAGVGKEEIPYGPYCETGPKYSYSSFDMMTEEEARAAGVPEGYSGYVLKLTGASSGMSIGLDLSQYRVRDIESITFRVYCPASTKDNGVRLANDTKDSWIMLADPGVTEEWVDIVLSPESNFNTSEKSFSVLDDGNGYCKAVNFCFRFNGTNETGYIDSITVNLKAPDVEAPVIVYDGPTVIETTEGRDFVLDLTAYDEYDGDDIEPEYIWSDGAFDDNGELTEGEHSCTVKATDYAGNTATLLLKVNVCPRDTVAPTLSWAPERIVAFVGSKPVFDVKATDNVDEVVAEQIWSEGALDEYGRLVEGEHILTLRAVDLTGNETIVDVEVCVTDEIDENIVIDTQ